MAFEQTAPAPASRAFPDSRRTERNRYTPRPRLPFACQGRGPPRGPRHGGRTPAAPDRFRAGKPVRCGPRENPAPRASAASNCVRPAPPSAPGKSRRTGCSWPRPRKGHRTQHAANQLHPSLPGHRPCASQGSERRSPDRTCRCPACRTGSAARTIPEYAGTLRSPGASTAVPCA
jgi:hypothetical protein